MDEKCRLYFKIIYFSPFVLTQNYHKKYYFNLKIIACCFPLVLKTQSDRFYRKGASFVWWSLKFSKQLESTFEAFLSSGFGPQRLSFSIVECWWRMAKRFTWTGMGTTILFPPFDDDPRLPMLCDVRPALTRFHFARRFWNQILIWKGKRSAKHVTKTIRKLTWTSLSLSVVAIWLRSVKLRYFLAWNSRSSSRSCSLVNAVRRRRDFPDFGPSPEFSKLSSSSSPVSFSEHSESELHNSAKTWYWINSTAAWLFPPASNYAVAINRGIIAEINFLWDFI